MSQSAISQSPKGVLVQVTPAQRAAVIIAMLGDTAAKPIVEKLDDSAMAKVAKTLEDISMLTRDQLLEIVVDFLSHLRNAEGALRGGKAQARELISGLLDPARVGVILGDAPQAPQPVAKPTGTIWEQLEQQDSERLAAYLNRLSPNLIAMILRKLNVATTSEVFCGLDESKLGPVMGYLVEEETLDPSVDSVIQRMVEMEFLNDTSTAGADSSEHLESIGELLSLLPGDKREALVGFLQTQHESKLQSIQQSIFTIDGLPELLPRASVPVIFREVDRTQLVSLLASLQGDRQAVSDFLLGNISSRMADQFRDELTEVRQPTGEAAEAVQRDFLTSLMRLRRSGDIAIERPEAA